LDPPARDAVNQSAIGTAACAPPEAELDGGLDQLRTEGKATEQSIIGIGGNAGINGITIYPVSQPVSGSVGICGITINPVSSGTAGNFGITINPVSQPVGGTVGISGVSTRPGSPTENSGTVRVSGISTKPGSPTEKRIYVIERVGKRNSFLFPGIWVTEWRPLNELLGDSGVAGSGVMMKRFRSLQEAQAHCITKNIPTQVLNQGFCEQLIRSKRSSVQIQNVDKH